MRRPVPDLAPYLVLTARFVFPDQTIEALDADALGSSITQGLEDAALLPAEAIRILSTVAGRAIKSPT